MPTSSQPSAASSSSTAGRASVDASRRWTGADAKSGVQSNRILGPSQLLSEKTGPQGRSYVSKYISGSNGGGGLETGRRGLRGESTNLYNRCSGADLRKSTNRVKIRKRISLPAE